MSRAIRRTRARMDCATPTGRAQKPRPAQVHHDQSGVAAMAAARPGPARTRSTCQLVRSCHDVSIPEPVARTRPAVGGGRGHGTVGASGAPVAVRGAAVSGTAGAAGERACGGDGGRGGGREASAGVIAQIQQMRSNWAGSVRSPPTWPRRRASDHVHPEGRGLSSARREETHVRTR